MYIYVWDIPAHNIYFLFFFLLLLCRCLLLLLFQFIFLFLSFTHTYKTLLYFIVNIKKTKELVCFSAACFFGLQKINVYVAYFFWLEMQYSLHTFWSSYFFLLVFLFMLYKKVLNLFGLSEFVGFYLDLR